MWNMILFFVMQFINVVLNTLKSFCTIKSSKHLGMFMNVTAYTFYVAVVKMLTEQPMWYVCLVTAITNCIGFYLADLLFNKMQKDKLWRISMTTDTDTANEIGNQLSLYNIGYNEIHDESCGKTILDVFSYTQGESSLIKDIIKDKKVKYHIMVIDKKL